MFENLEPRLFLDGGSLAAPCLPDQVMSHTQDQLVLMLPEQDAAGNLLSYTAAAKTPAAEAAALRQQLGLKSYVPSYYNCAGRSEKWLQDSKGGWHYIVADGRVYRWAGTLLEGQVDAAYYADPQSLLSVQDSGPAAVALAVAGNCLVIDPDAGFAGRFLVDVTATNGAAQATGSFAVTVTNAAPVLDIIDQAMSHRQDRLVLSLPATDPGGDTVQYTASARPCGLEAYELKARLDLVRYINWGGSGQKWLQSRSGAWFLLAADGKVRRFTSGQVEGQVGAEYYANPQLLIDAQAPAPLDVSVAVAGNQLIIDPADGYAGKFQVSVTASDGLVQVQDAFIVTVANTAPVLALANQTLPHTQDALTLTLPATDADGDAVTYTASVSTGGALAQELRGRLGLTSYASQYNNCSGRGEKWLLGTGGWFYMLSDGKVYRSNGQLEGQVDTEYYADPQRLFQVQAGGTPAVAVSIAGNRLTIDPPDGYSGRFQVIVTASDGIAKPVQATLNVTVLPANDPTTYTPGSQVATRVVSLAGGLEFVVLGTNGADTIVLSQASQSVTLTTSAGTSTYSGQFSNITVYSFDGNDTIRTLQSVTAAVTIRAGDGNDSVFAAGPGRATVYGDAGDDLIVTVGGGADTVYGGAGLDSFWVDNSDTVADASASETAAAGVHRITAFYQPTDDPAQAVSLEIAGQDIVDPVADYAYRSYASTPLFTDGPEYSDIRQGALGDCYFMASLASLAQTDPTALRQMVAPMGDGTYAVRFYGVGGEETYVRVDASLPAYGSTPAYARLTPDGEAWVAVAEKAYAQFRYGANSYASLNGGWMEPVYYAVTGAATGSMYTNIANIAGIMADYLSAGHALTAASRESPPGPAVGNHAYMIKSVETVGDQTEVTVYNPWGFDGNSWDSNTSDGLLKMSLATFSQNFFALSYCMA
ncbi:MAG: C2 family cysteine protease [Planctomycetota bacterium]|nr:C2 family cysteine protease [Planctomycetota bacterium]